MSFISIIFHQESIEKDFLIVSRDLVLHCLCCQIGLTSAKLAIYCFSAIRKMWHIWILKRKKPEIEPGRTPWRTSSKLFPVLCLQLLTESSYIFKIIGRILIGQKLLLVLLSSLDTGATSPAFKNGGKMVFCKQLSKTECNIPLNNLYFV